MSKDKKHHQEKLKEEQWIEMDDLRDPQNQNISRKLAQMEGVEYIPPSVLPQDLSYPDISTFPSQQESSKESSPEPKAYVPQIQPERKRAPPSLPLMEVTCDFCTVCQQVPGSTQVYCCGSCENMNECYPLYGIIICGCCQVKFGFGFGMSEYVKCPKCSSVNKVPLEPKKQYRSASILQSENLGGYPNEPERSGGQREREYEEDEYYQAGRRH